MELEICPYAAQELIRLIRHYQIDPAFNQPLLAEALEALQNALDDEAERRATHTSY